MIENKRGMSDIVVTLVIILLSLLAIGVVWVVVSGLIKTGTENVNWNAQCTNVQVEVTAVSCNVVADSTDNCTVTLKKTGTTSELSGVELLFFNSTGNGNQTVTVAGDLGTSIPRNLGTQYTYVKTPNKVQVIPYFKDSSNVVHKCTSQTVTHSFNFA